MLVTIFFTIIVMSWCAIKSHFINHEKNLKSLKLLMKNLKFFFWFFVENIWAIKT